MDPSIMKLLEDDEDESMHSGADVEAFTAALNRDIGRDDVEITTAPEHSAGLLSQESSSSISSQLPGQRQASSQEINPSQQIQQQDEHPQLHQEKHSSQTEEIDQQSIAKNLHQESVLQPRQSQGTSDQEQIHTEKQQQCQLVEPDVKSVENNHIQFPEHPSAQSQEDRVQNRQQFPAPQPTNQQSQSSDQANNPMRKMRLSSIPFHSLIPVLRPHLDKDRSMQLNNVFSKLKSNEISREDFLRVIRNIVGDQMLRQAAHKVMQAQALAARNSQASQNQHQVQTQLPQQLPSRSTAQFPEPNSYSQVHLASSFQHENSQRPPSSATTVQMRNDSQLDGQGLHAPQLSSTSMVTVKQERESSAISLQTMNKQQSHSQHPPTSFPMQGGATGNYKLHSFPRPPISAPATLKSQSQDSQLRPIPLPQVALSTQSVPSHPVNLMNASKYEMQSAVSDTKRLQPGSLSNYANQPILQQNQMAWQHSSNKEQRSGSASSMAYVKQELMEQTAEQHVASKTSSFGTIDIDIANPASGSSKDEINEKLTARMAFPNTPTATQLTGPKASQPDSTMPTRVPSVTPPLLAGTNPKTPPKKTGTSQKKTHEAQGTPSPASSKKQKVSGAFQDQSIEQLNDVTAVSGVNLREEEEQLLSAPKEESRASEATRRAVQEEEEKLILQKLPLQKKIAEIMSKCGIKDASNDVERCLSLCVEERLRSLINNIIRLSKQRVDIEKARHRIAFTSDVRRQILAINRQAKEDWDRKQAEEAEKLRKLNESEGNTTGDSEKDKDEGRSKTPKPNKEEDDKMRTTAANVAARAAVGGDDMLSKWQLMAEQARQKREGGADGTSSSNLGKASGRNALQNIGKASRDSQDGDRKGGGAAATSGAMKRVGRSPAAVMHPKVVRSITTKDVIAVLEKEPQMSKSALLYRLYERSAGEPGAE